MEPAVDVRGLRKVFRNHVAVDSLTLSVEHGEVFGFLGPNGAGKTTSIKMLMGLVYPTAGSARLLGRKLGDRVARRDIGYLPELFRFHEWLTGSEFLIVVSMQMGCVGFVGGLHNICPQIAVALYRAFLSGDMEQTRKLQRDLTATWQIFRYGNIWGAFDEALRYLGIAQRATGAPYISKVTTEEAQIIRATLDEYVKPYLLATAPVD